MNEALITVKQLPIIEEQLNTISEKIKLETQQALSLACTEETLSAVKKSRANLNQIFSAIEADRKAVKSAVLAPYNSFEAVYKEKITDIMKGADSELKARIAEVENVLKAEKSAELEQYFNDLAKSYGLDFVKYSDLNAAVTRTASLNKLREQASVFLCKILDDIEIIRQQEHKDEILAEYKQTLNLKRSIEHINSIYASIKADKEKQAPPAPAKITKAIEPPPPAPPAPKEPKEKEQVLTLTFTVTATRSNLKALKNFILEGDYKIE